MTYRYSASNRLMSDNLTKLISYTVGDGDSSIFLDTTANSIDLTLPDPADYTDRVITVTKTNAADYEVAIAPTTGSIGTRSTFYLWKGGDFVRAISDGTDWKIIGHRQRRLVVSASGTSSSSVNFNLPGAAWTPDITGTYLFEFSGSIRGNTTSSEVSLAVGYHNTVTQSNLQETLRMHTGSDWAPAAASHIVTVVPTHTYSLRGTIHSGSSIDVDNWNWQISLVHQ